MHETRRPPTPHAALALYTVREALTTDRHGTLSRIREAGFGAVETAGFAAELPSAATAEELAGFDLHVVSSYFVGPPERFPEHLDEQRAAGNDTIVLGLDATYFGDRASVGRAVEVVNEFAEQCAAKSMRLGYHNHPWEVNRLENGQSALELLVQGFDAEIFLEFDFYWAQVGGLSIADARTIAGSRIRRLHLKDGPLTDTQVASVFGQGAFDIPSAISAASGAQWKVIAFDEFDGDFVEASAADLRYLVDHDLLSGHDGA